jgi:molybdopterin-containing oxidoreductase family membrane subunit
MYLRNFISGSIKNVFSGSRLYLLWVSILIILIGIGCIGYAHQLKNGLITTSMRDQVSWGFYIGNFTFLVGIAAAAIILVIPAYIYNWKPIKEITLLGELLAISAILMCLFFVIVDLGQPGMIWHMIPVIGKLQMTGSILAWDSVVLLLYLILNMVIAFHILFRTYKNKPNHKFILPLIYFSIPAGIAIHTVTAFLYDGISARPFWNSAILAPRFLASAFCSGPAIMLIIFQVLRKTTRFKISNEALWKIGELMAYTIFVNLFLTGAEIFKEFYSDSEQFVHSRYLYFGIDGDITLVPFIWTALVFNIIAFVLFLVPSTRKNFTTLNIGAVLIFLGVYIEKGMGLIIPGFTPDALGEIYKYLPSWTEISVTMGIFSMGFLIYTLLIKAAIPIMLGEFDHSVNRGKIQNKLNRMTDNEINEKSE